MHGYPIPVPSHTSWGWRDARGLQEHREEGPSFYLGPPHVQPSLEAWPSRGTSKECQMMDARERGQVPAAGAKTVHQLQLGRVHYLMGCGTQAQLTEWQGRTGE